MSRHKYPNTNFDELNLDWVIDEIGRTTEINDDTKKYADETLEKSKEYESLSKLHEEHSKTYMNNAMGYAINAQNSEVAAKASKDASVEYLRSTAQQVNRLNSQVDNIIPSGTQTEGNTELIDLRVGSYNRIYTSAGNAVRGQVDELRGEFDKLAVNWNMLRSPVSLFENKFLNAQGTLEESADYYTAFFNASPNLTYYLYSDANTTASVIHKPRIAVLFDEYGSILNHYEYPNQVSSDNPDFYQFGVSFKYKDNAQKWKSSNDYVTSSVDRVNKLIGIIDDDNIIDNTISVTKIKDLFTNWNMIKRSDATIKERTYTNAQGVESANSVYYTVYVPIKSNDTYYLYSGAFTHASEGYNHRPRMAVLFDENDNVITHFEYPNQVTTNNVNVAKMAICLQYIDGTQLIKSPDDYIADKVEHVNSFNGLIDDSNILDNSISAIKIKGIGSIRGFANSETRVATINFQFDDGNPRDSEIVDIFKNNGLRCGFALISNNTRLGTYKGYQNDGFEIMSHSTDGEAMESGDIPIVTIENKMINSKVTLENAGLNVRSWVTPNSALNPIYLPSVKKYYDSAYTKHRYSTLIDDNCNSINDDTCELWRCSLGIGNAFFLKSLVDEAINIGGFLTFYGHSADLGSQFTADSLNELLSYVKSKVDILQCKCLVPSDAADYYFHFRHRDFLNLQNQ